MQLPRTVKSVNFNNYNTVTLRTLLLLHAARQLKGSVSCSGVDSAAAWNKGSSLLLASSLRSSFQGYRGFIHYRFLSLLSYSLLLASCLRSSFQGYKEFTRFLSLLSYFPQTFSKCTFYPRFLSSILPYFPIFHLLYYSIIFSLFLVLILSTFFILLFLLLLVSFCSFSLSSHFSSVSFLSFFSSYFSSSWSFTFSSLLAVFLFFTLSLILLAYIVYIMPVL